MEDYTSVLSRKLQQIHKVTSQLTQCEKSIQNPAKKKEFKRYIARLRILADQFVVQKPVRSFTYIPPVKLSKQHTGTEGEINAWVQKLLPYDTILQLQKTDEATKQTLIQTLLDSASVPLNIKDAVEQKITMVLRSG
jgi:CRISPR/Cas system CMR subunit Cmr4 (Cas7 group RAMP superfamily)